jgi:hypothetical protein
LLHHPASTTSTPNPKIQACTPAQPRRLHVQRPATGTGTSNCLQTHQHPVSGFILKAVQCNAKCTSVVETCCRTRLLDDTCSSNARCLAPVACRVWTCLVFHGIPDLVLHAGSNSAPGAAHSTLLSGRWESGIRVPAPKSEVFQTTVPPLVRSTRHGLSNHGSPNCPKHTACLLPHNAVQPGLQCWPRQQPGNVTPSKYQSPFPPKPLPNAAQSIRQHRQHQLEACPRPNHSRRPKGTGACRFKTGSRGCPLNTTRALLGESG